MGKSVVSSPHTGGNVEVIKSISADLTILAQALGELANRGYQSALIFGCDDNGWDIPHLNDILKAAKVRIAGGIFPGILHSQSVHYTGFAVVGLPYEIESLVIKGLSDQKTLEPELYAWSNQVGFNGTLLTIVDGFSKNIDDLVEGLFNTFGLEMNYFGGGAGKLSFETSPCILTDSGVLSDAALIAHYPGKSSVSVQHGWKRLAGPLRITSSDKNVVRTINWRPAFEVYAEILEANKSVIITRDNFFNVAQAFPFGLNKMSGEPVVRDPVKVLDDGSIVCVGSLPQESLADILFGLQEDLLTAATETRQEAMAECEDEAVVGVAFDCISRALFLGDRFTEEAERLLPNNIPTAGALAIGEIANNGKRYLDFYNKTSVVTLLS